MKNVFVYAIIALASLNSLASELGPTAQLLDQNSSKFFQQQSATPDGMMSLDFLKTAKKVAYYSIDKFHDYGTGLIEPKNLAVFSAVDRNSQFTFGVLFDQKGKAEKFVTLTANSEGKCIPYYISNEKVFKVYYVAVDRSSNEALLFTRSKVISALITRLRAKNLLTNFEQVTSRLMPNDSHYEKQESLTISNSLRMRQSLVVQAFKDEPVAGAERVFAGLDIAGGPSHDTFNPQSNATCVEIK